MQHLKQIITTLVALFAMTTGAWADKGTLLTTINASSDFTSGSKTFDNVATVTFDEEVSYTDYAGWYAGGSPISVTVAPVDGVTITSVKFFIGDNSAEDTQAPFTATLYIDNGMALQTQVNDTYYDGGLKKIEVYGTAGTALTKDKNDATGKTWILEKMPAGNVELQVEYEPEFTATFVAKNGNTIESGKATVSVKEGEAAAVAATLEGNALKGLYEGQTVTLTAAQGYKFRDVTAKKAGGATITVEDVTLDISGCTTWENVVAKNSDKIECPGNGVKKKGTSYFLTYKTGDTRVNKTENVKADVEYYWKLGD